MIGNGPGPEAVEVQVGVAGLERIGSPIHRLDAECLHKPALMMLEGNPETRSAHVGVHGQHVGPMHQPITL